MNDISDRFTPEEAIEYAEVESETFYNWLLNKKLPYEMDKGLVTVGHEDLYQFLNALEDAGVLA